MAIGGLDPGDRPVWECAEGGHAEASYLSAAQGLPIIERLLAIYMGGHNS
jgi:hypothetical protein